MRVNLIGYISTLVLFLGLDFVWLSLTGQAIYKARLGSLMLDKPNLQVALCFYLVYAVSLVVFAVAPALEGGSWVRAAWAGALLGFTAYGTYDFTNQATIAGWSSFVTVADLAWGTFASAAAATAGYFITRFFAS